VGGWWFEGNERGGGGARFITAGGGGGGRLGIIVGHESHRLGHNKYSIQFGYPQHYDSEVYEFKGKNMSSYQIVGILPPVE